MQKFILLLLLFTSLFADKKDFIDKLVSRDGYLNKNVYNDFWSTKASEEEIAYVNYTTLDVLTSKEKYKSIKESIRQNTIFRSEKLLTLYDRLKAVNAQELIQITEKELNSAIQNRELSRNNLPTLKINDEILDDYIIELTLISQRLQILLTPNYTFEPIKQNFFGLQVMWYLPFKKIYGTSSTHMMDSDWYECVLENNDKVNIATYKNNSQNEITEDLSKKYNTQIETNTSHTYNGKDYLSIKSYTKNNRTYYIIAISNTMINAKKLLDDIDKSVGIDTK